MITVILFIIFLLKTILRLLWNSNKAEEYCLL